MGVRPITSTYMDKEIIKLKPHHNYVAFFLTLSCNLKCPYCINIHNGASRVSQVHRNGMTADDWIKAANRLVLRDDLPLTIQGGEPTLYKGFYKFVNEVKPAIKMDLLTNLMFNVDEFVKRVPVWRFNRIAPYAPIRVSYHPGQNNIDDLIRKTLKLEDAGFKVGLFGILHPDGSLKDHILKVKERCLNIGIDFRTKEFLGEYNGTLYGTFKYKCSVNGSELKICECRTTELIVDSAGYIYKCHADLYKGRNTYAHILDEKLNEDSIDEFRPCSFYGDCNPCDVKIKTNRFQEYGHTSVEIRNVKSK